MSSTSPVGWQRSHRTAPATPPPPTNHRVPAFHHRPEGPWTAPYIHHRAPGLLHTSWVPWILPHTMGPLSCPACPGSRPEGWPCPLLLCTASGFVSPQGATSAHSLPQTLPLQGTVVSGILPSPHSHGAAGKSFYHCEKEAIQTPTLLDTPALSRSSTPGGVKLDPSSVYPSTGTGMRPIQPPAKAKL